MRKLWVISLFSLLVFLAVTPWIAFGQQEEVWKWRCEGGIVVSGASKDEVMINCGDPSAIEQNGAVWIYDLRPEQFIFTLTFNGELLERIQVSK